MGRKACTEPQCLYKGALYLYLLPISIISQLLHTHLQLHAALTVGTNGRTIGTLYKGMRLQKSESIE